MIDAVLRSISIILLLVIIFGAGDLAWWLIGAWIPKGNVVPLTVEAFDVSHGDKSEKEEGKHLAKLFVKKLIYIQNIMSADLSNLKDLTQIRIESVAPKSANLSPDVSVKFDAEMKAFDVDVIGVFEKLHKFFDRSDRLQTSFWIDEKVKMFGSLRRADEEESLGPWWIKGEKNEEAVVDEYAFSFALSFYKSKTRGLDELDFVSFRNFVDGVGRYQACLRALHADTNLSQSESLKVVADTLEDIVKGGKASALVYSYLASVRSLQNRTNDAFAAYQDAVRLDPDDAFAKKQIERLTAARALQPHQIAKEENSLDAIRMQVLNSYFKGSLPTNPGKRSVAIIGTGISPALSRLLGSRLLYSGSVVKNETSPDDKNGHGTAVASLVAALAPDAGIISVKVLSAQGVGDTDEIIKGIDSAVEKKANIIVVPLASGKSDAIERAIKSAFDAGILVVAAAGNDYSGPPSYPARIDGVVAAGALDRTGKVAQFSSTGESVLYSDGVNIRAFGLDNAREYSGTSFSSAIVAAIAAVVWGVKPTAPAKNIYDILYETAEVSSLQNETIKSIDADAALARASRHEPQAEK